MRSFLSFLFLLLISVDGYSLPDYKVTLKAEKVALKHIFRDIEQQTGLYFMYSTTHLKEEEKVSIHVTDKKLDEVLHALLDARGIRWELKDKAIVLRVAEKRDMSFATIGEVNVLKGTVVNKEGIPLPGASLQIKGSKSGTITDVNGNFSLQHVPDNAVLLVRYTGYETKEIKIDGRDALTVELEASINGLDETVVVAYGTTTQRSNTSAITVVKGEQIQSLPNRSVDKSLQGLVPGLLVTNGTGQPGGGVSNFVLRGITTGTDAFFGSTVRNPLIVIDGIPVTQDHFQQVISSAVTAINNPMSQLNPSDIETITVLKDASAVALYGSKASNGVILITTKSGKPGKTIFSFRHQTDIASSLRGNIDMVTEEQYMELLYETYKNTNPTLWTDEAIRRDLYTKFPYRVTGTDTSFYPAPNWFNELHNRNAVTVSNEISMSGGNEKTKFYVNVEYLKQDGVVKETGFNRKSLRFNLESKPIEQLKIGIGSSLSHTSQDYSNPLETTSAYALGYIMSPLNPVRLEDGIYKLNYAWGATQSATSQVANPAALAEYNINKNQAYRGITKVYGELSLFRYFTLSSILGLDFMLGESKEKFDPRLISSGKLGGYIRELNTRRNSIINTNTLRFNRTWRATHTLEVLAGQEAQIRDQKELQGEVTGTEATFPYYEEINSPGYTQNTARGRSGKQTSLSQFGQTNYGFRNKYFLSASIRRDAASVFGEQQRWGTYWSVGSGWVISEENFLRHSGNLLSYLKIRGSIGIAGSAGAISNSTRYEQLEVRKFEGQTALVPASLGNGISGNPNIKWESTFTWDAGLEAKLVDSRLSLTADVYSKKTSNLIYNSILPLTTGYLNVLNNIGDLNNFGVEISLSANIIKSRGFGWNVQATWSTNNNKLIKANVPLTTLTGGLLANEEGKNFNTFYLKQWAGVNPDDGKPQWRDSTGKPLNTYADAPRMFVGKPQPDGFGSIINTLSWKSFSISANLYYQYGFQIYDQSLQNSMLNDGTTPYVNQISKGLDRWQKPGDIAQNPVRKLNNNDGGSRQSTRYLFDGDYIRLKNVSLGYLFSKSILQKIRLNSLRVYVEANNLAIWSKYPGLDPDNSNVGGAIAFSYPTQRTFSFGVNTSF